MVAYRYECGHTGPLVRIIEAAQLTVEVCSICKPLPVRMDGFNLIPGQESEGVMTLEGRRLLNLNDPEASLVRQGRA